MARMADAKPQNEPSFSRFQHAANNWRNERQKSMLLNEASRLGPRRVAKNLCDESARLIEQSRKIRERSEAIKGAKNR